MALNYLLSPEFQIVNTAGKPATGGYLEVYISGSRERYYCASDFNGTLYPFQVPLDSLGSNVVLADDSQAYDVYVYNRYGGELMSRYNVHPGAGGGIGGGDITSSDGSLIVTETANGVDLRVNSTPPSILRATAETLYMDGQFTFAEAQRDGDNAIVDAQGKVIVNEGWWHYDATVRLRWTGPAQNETQAVSLYTQTASDSLTFDMSFAHSETVQISGEFKAQNDSTQFVLGVTQVPSGMSVELVDFGVHSIINGSGGNYAAGEGIVIDATNRIISIDPDVVQEKLTAGEGITIDSDDNTIAVDFDDVQGKLTAGSNISIDPLTNTISATAAPQQQADWDQNDSTAVDYIKNKPTIPSGSQLVPSATPSDAGEVLTVDSNGDPTWAPAQAQAPISAGDGIDITNNVVSAKVDGTTVTVNASGELVATASAQQVQSDWAQSDSSAVDYIKNKPDLSQYATTTDLSGKADKVTGATAGDVAVLDANGNLTDTGIASANLVHDASYVHTDENFTSAEKTKLSGIESGAEANVQANWTESNSSSDAYIQNKPAQANLVAGTNITITESGNDVTISAASGTAPVQDVTIDNVSVVNAQGVAEIPRQVNADWNSSAGASEILNKPTIPSATSDLTNDSGFITSSDIPVTDVEVDGVSVVSQGVASITMPTVPTATSDLLNDSGYITASDVPASQTQADWSESDTTDPSYIQNKPTLATVATSGSYNDLVNTPSIPTATSDLQNDSGFITASDVPANQTQSDWSESDTTDPSYIQNKPSQANLVAGNNITITESGNDVTISASVPTVPVNDVEVGGSSVVNAQGVAEVPAQVQADWSESNSAAADYIKNKPSIPVIGTISV